MRINISLIWSLLRNSKQLSNDFVNTLIAFVMDCRAVIHMQSVVTDSNSEHFLSGSTAVWSNSLMERQLLFSAETFRCSKCLKRLELWLFYFVFEISWASNFNDYLLKQYSDVSE